MRGEMLQHYEEPKKAKESDKAAELFNDFSSAKDELELLIAMDTGEPLSEERSKFSQNETRKAGIRLQKAENRMMRDKEGRALLADKFLSLFSSFKFDDAEKLFYRLSPGAGKKIIALPEIQSCVKETALAVLMEDPNKWHRAKIILDTFIPNDKERAAFKLETETQQAVKRAATHCLAQGMAQLLFRDFNEIVQYFVLEPEFTKEAIEEVYYYLLSQGDPNHANLLAQERIVRAVSGQYFVSDQFLRFDNQLEWKATNALREWKLTENPQSKESSHKGVKLALLEKRWGHARLLLDNGEFFNESEKSDMLKQSLIHHLHNGDMPAVANVIAFVEYPPLEENFFNDEDVNIVFENMFIKRLNQNEIHFFNEFSRNYWFGERILKDSFARNSDLQAAVLQKLCAKIEAGEWNITAYPDFYIFACFFIVEDKIESFVKENQALQESLKRRIVRELQSLQDGSVLQILENLVSYYSDHQALFNMEDIQAAALEAARFLITRYNVSDLQKLIAIIPISEKLAKDETIRSAANHLFLFHWNEGEKKEIADLMSILGFGANEEREFTEECISEYLTEGVTEESRAYLKEAIRGEKKLIETCLKYPNDRVVAKMYGVRPNVASAIRNAVQDSRNSEEVRRRIEKFEQNPYSVFRFAHDEQVNTQERQPLQKPEINEEDILNDMAVFAEYTALFNDQKLNLPPDLMKQILGEKLFEQVIGIQTSAKEFLPDPIERTAIFNLIDLQSALNDEQRSIKNAYAVLFHGTNKEAAEAIVSQSGLKIQDGSDPGTFASSHLYLSFDHYSHHHHTHSNNKFTTKGGLILYPREALRKSHVEGVRQFSHPAEGYIVDAEGRFTRIPFSAGINVSADNRADAETNICRAIFIIQKAKELNILNEIKEKFAAFLKDQGLCLEKMYRLMRSQNYPEEKIVEARDSYARYALQRRASTPQAHEKFTVCQKILDSYNDQDGTPAIKAKADISMIIDLMEEYPEVVQSSEDIQEKSAYEIEGAIQKKIRKLQRRKFLESLREGRKQGGFYARFKERLGTLHKAGYEHLMRLTPSKLSHLACGEINGEKLAETHASIQEIERELAEMLKYTLRSALPPALERLRSESATLQELLEQRKDRWSVALTGSGGRGIPSMTSDLDFVFYLNDEHLTEDEKADLLDALSNLKTHIVSVLKETGGVTVDAAQMNVQPIVALSNVKQLVLEDAPRQAVEPISVLESQPVDKDISFMLPFQKALIEKQGEVSGFLQKELKTEKFFRWMYSTSELWSGDSIKDFKKDIMRTVEWVFMCTLLTRVSPDQIAEPIPAEMLKKIQWARERAILTEEEANLFNQLITDIARWKLRGDIISQNSKDIRFDSMMLTNKERQRFVEYANFINGLVTEDIKEKMKEEIIIN